MRRATSGGDHNLETARFRERLAYLIDALADVMLQMSEPMPEQALN